MFRDPSCADYIHCMSEVNIRASFPKSGPYPCQLPATNLFRAERLISMKPDMTTEAQNYLIAKSHGGPIYRAEIVCFAARVRRVSVSSTEYL